jgi:hypothetical protein
MVARRPPTPEVEDVRAVRAICVEKVEADFGTGEPLGLGTSMKMYARVRTLKHALAMLA